MSDIYMTTEIQVWPIGDLKPYGRNARIHSEEQLEELQASIEVFGFVCPLLITSDGGVLCGHGRLEAARRAGMMALPCVLADHLSKEQQAAYILADNRLAEHAKWDKAMVSAELVRLRDAGFDISVTGLAKRTFFWICRRNPSRMTTSTRSPGRVNSCRTAACGASVTIVCW